MAAHIKAFVKTEIFGNHPVHFIYLRGIASEKFDKARFGSGSTAASEKLDVFQRKIDFVKIQKKILHPECGTFSCRNKLRGLVVCITESGKILVFLRKGRKVRENLQQLTAQVAERVPEYNEIGIVGYITACSSEMNNARGGRSRLPVCMNMSHDIMAQFLLIPAHAGVVYIVDVGFKLCDLRLGYRKAELHLGFCKGYP